MTRWAIHSHQHLRCRRSADASAAGSNPRNVEALNEIGALITEQGHLDKALKAFEAAIEIDPTFEKAYRNLYTVLYTNARYEEAAGIINIAIKNISSDYRWNFRVDQILCLWKAGFIEDAKQTAEALISELELSTDPSHQKHLLHALNNYGVILLEVENPDKAEKAIPMRNRNLAKYCRPLRQYGQAELLSREFTRSDLLV